MAKFSVKKPLTIFVAVIAVLVMGFVAFTSMTPDLFPNIDMPYIMLITPYPGSTPEKVEAAVTKPLEQRMATLDNIDKITSTSNANVSIITMQFTSDVNMDTIAVDILQGVNQLQSGWDEMVGSPTILKLNPSMIPVMVAAVNMQGMDTPELSMFMENTLLNRLEGIDGVASISADGIVTEQVHVLLNQDKIDAVNEKVQAAVLAQFAEMEEELERSREKLEGELNALSGAAGQLEKGLDELAQKSAEGETLLNEKQMELLQGKLAITQQLMVMKALQGEAQQSYATLLDLRNQYAALQIRKADLETAVATWGDIETFLGGPGNTADDLTDAQKAFIAANGVALADVDATLAGQKKNEATAELLLVNADIARVDAALAALGITATGIDAALAELDAVVKRLAGEVAELESMLAMLDTGQIALDEAMQKLSATKLTTQYEMSTASAKIVAGQSSLVLALTQLESGESQLEDAREAALKQANMHNMVTMQNVASILMAQNFSMPAGYVHEGYKDVLVAVGDELASVEELAQLVLFDLDMEDLAPIRLEDVADVYMADNADEVYAKIGGSDGVLLTFSKQSNYSTATVSNNIRAEFEKLAAEYEGLEFYSMMDQGDYIYIVVNSILKSLLWGALFAIIILALFLKDIRPTFITLCSIPISVIFAIGLMYFTGVTINIISLSGLAVSVGMLVDNSVVVIENIYRLRGQGVSAARASVAGASQVAGAIAASTLTTICVFLPIVFIEGLTRELFTDMALTITYALLASLIVAMTLVPAMSSKLLVKAQPKESRVLDGVLRVYEKTLGWMLRRKAVVLVGSVLLLALSLVLVLARGFTFMPDMNMPQISVNIRLPEDKTTEDVIAVTDEVLARIATVDGVQTSGAMLSGGGIMGMNLGSGGGNGSLIYVLLDEKVQTRSAEIGDEILALCADLPATITASSESGTAELLVGGAGVSVKLFGNDLNELQAAARQVAAALEGLDGTAEVSDGIGKTSPELRFVVDREKAAAYGLTTAQVYQELSKALANERVSTSLLYDGNEYDVLVISGDEDRLTPGYIRSHRFTVKNFAGEEMEVSLGEIATVEEGESKVAIERDAQRRTLSVSAALAPGSNVTLVTREAQKLLQDLDLPSGITYEFAGENESIMTAFSELIKMLLLGVLLVYLIMVAQFQSLVNPFIVMFTIPLAFTGGLLALFLTGMELSVISLIGFVMLVGIIVNNGIVLVDYINQLRVGGMPKREAIIKAGLVRLRPILMTSLTTILGLSMMAFGTGLGSELMQPIAIVCIGGLLYATLLTLFVVPVMYDILNRREMKVVREEDLRPVHEGEMDVDAGDVAGVEQVPAGPPAGQQG